MTPLPNTQSFLAVITGAAGGLGASLAREAASMSMTVILADIAYEAAQAQAAAITKSGGNAHAVQVDVSKPESIAEFTKWVHENHGHPRILINNAAVETLGLSWEVPTARWETTLNVNIHGVVHCVQGLLPGMIESGEECWVVNVCSVGAFISEPGQTAYLMTKHGMQAFTEGLYLEMQMMDHRIHVSTACPGLLRTNIFDKSTSPGSTGSEDRLARYQRHLGELAQEHGMDTDSAAKKILEQALRGKFWIWTHEDLGSEFLKSRAEFLTTQALPSAPEGTRHLYNFDV
jgi:NAD(P)-dependent dehydrogenase (short-subunit alcohol dehydrogenase family)